MYGKITASMVVANVFLMAWWALKLHKAIEVNAKHPVSLEYDRYDVCDIIDVAETARSKFGMIFEASVVDCCGQERFWSKKWLARCQHQPLSGSITIGTVSIPVSSHSWCQFLQWST